VKNKEEPSANSQRENPSEQVDLDRSGGVGSETTDSLSRPGRNVAARAEQPALSMFPMSLMEAVVDGANIETAWKNVKANRGRAPTEGWSRPRRDHHCGIPRLVSASLADDSTTASRWHVPARTGAKKGHRQTRWRSAFARGHRPKVGRQT